MSVAPLVALPHSLVVAVEQLEGALDRMQLAAWAGVEPVAVRDLVERLMRVEARIKAHQVAGVRILEASGLAKAVGATSTGAMLAGAFGADRPGGDHMVHMGAALEIATRTEDALARGEIGPSQAAIIAKAVADLPEDTTESQRQACEDTLIGDAPQFNLKDLRNRSMRMTDQFKPAPEVDQIENDTLVRREKAAWKRAEFWMVSVGDGTCRGAFRIPQAQADMLMAAIHAISAPKRDHVRDHPAAVESYYDQDLDYRHRLGATLMVRLDYDTLIQGIKAATLSTGTRITAGQARLMACNLGIVPQVFNGKSLPLDHGHEQRTFTKAQKQALANRDGGCTFPGCDRPPEWCEGHHWRRRWADGATTTLQDGVLICPFHHRAVHSDNWAIRMDPNGGHPEYRANGSHTWQHNR